LNGLAGTGKSTISRTVARRYFNRKRLGASFFFSRGGGDVGYAGMFVTSIALQLASSIPLFNKHLCSALSERRDIASQSLHDQWQQLVLSPLSKLMENDCQLSYILVVDALDECDNDNNIQTIIRLLGDTRSLKNVRLRIFLTSRPEIPIRHGFGQISNADHTDFILHSISPSIVDRDISVFLRYELECIARTHSLDSGWPGEQIVEELVRNANGLFIWAATACRFINEGRSFAADRLSTILTPDSMGDFAKDFSSDDSGTDDDSGDTAMAPVQHLDALYITVLQNSIHKYKSRERKKWRMLLGTTMTAIVTLSSPLSTLSLARLLDISQAQLDQTLNDLHAILQIPRNSSSPLRLHHPSFRDFLLTKKRCEILRFTIDEKQAHQTLADNCIHIMSKSLKQDICGVDAPGTMITSIHSSQIEQSLSSEVQYACLYWTQHTLKSGIQLCDDGPVHLFLQDHVLHWLEALAWMRKVSEGVYAMTSLESLASVSKS
jgi:hypothetical protein